MRYTVSYTLQAAQINMLAAVKADPEAIIAKAIAFRPDTAALVAELRKVPGPLVGIAVGAIRHALTGVDRQTSEANIVQMFGDDDY